MSNLGTTAYYQPVRYYDDEVIASKPAVKKMFDRIKDNRDKVIITFRNDPMAYGAYVEKTYRDFVLMKTRRIVEGEEVFIHSTVPYSDVLSRDVKIEGKGGKLESWGRKIPVPEKAMLKTLLEI